MIIEISIFIKYYILGDIMKNKEIIINGIEFKEYDSVYEAELLKVFIDAFEKYPLFYVFRNDFKTEEKYHDFYEYFMKVLFNATIRKDECYIGLKNGRIVTFLIIEKPTDKPVGFWDYVFTGGLKFIPKLGLSNTFKYLTLSEETEYVVKRIAEPRWHLYFIVVNTDNQGEGIGTDVIQDFLIPYVTENNGNLLTVTTNAEHNVKFYLDNGFTLIEKETLTYNNNPVENWSFKMELKNK